MNYPKMIIFDYGHTLLYEPGIDTLRGQKALFPYIIKNKNNLSAEEINDYSQKLFNQLGISREHGFELHERQFQQLLFEYLGIEFSIPLSEAEIIFWDNTSIGAPMPHIEKLLDAINAKAIRSAVISNITFSGAALKNRIDRLLPQNKFEFVIASSEYVFRKPNPILFELALKKADLSPTDVWYCGDNIKADVEASAAVGIYPVWYNEQTIENPWRQKNASISPACEHLHIQDWHDLIKILDTLPPTKKGSLGKGAVTRR